MKNPHISRHKIISQAPPLARAKGTEEKISHSVVGHKRDVSTFVIPTGFLVGGTRLVAEFECEFPLKENPNLDKVLRPIIDKAIVGEIYPGNVDKEVVIDKVKKSYFAQLALNSVPDTNSLPLMKKLVLWIFALFAYDNLIDEPTSLLHKNKEVLKEFTTDLTALLKTRINAKNLIQKWNSKMDASEIDQKLIKDTLLWIDQLKNFKLTDRFVGEAIRYYASSIVEMESGMHTQTVHYIDARRVSGAVPSVVALAESEMPDPPRYLKINFAFTELDIAYNDCIWAVNDLAGAKEMRGHEPNYLKTRMKEKLKEHLSRGAPKTGELVQDLFRSSFEELVEYINIRHQKWLEYKSDVIDGIATGKIFEIEKSGKLDPASLENKEIIRSALEDFKERCQIRENLFASGNQCTKVSSRYFDPENPKLNVEISELSFA